MVAVESSGSSVGHPGRQAASARRHSLIVGGWLGTIAGVGQIRRWTSREAAPFSAREADGS